MVLVCNDIRKVLFDVGFCMVEEVKTAVKIRKGTDAQTVGWMKLSLKKIAAGITDIG